MSVYEGVYKSLLQGVSQQTPQEREDGQLGEQINMLSDPVTGLRRRGGVKHGTNLSWANPSSYIEVVEVNGKYRAVIIDTSTGYVSVMEDITEPNTITRQSFTNTYLSTTKGKASIRTAVIRDSMYIVNTERVPDRILAPPNNLEKNPKDYGYFSVRSSQFSQKFTLQISYGDFLWQYWAYASDSVAESASPEYIAGRLVSTMNAHAPTAALFNFVQSGSTVAVVVKDPVAGLQLNVESLTTGGYLMASGVSRTDTKFNLLGTLPNVLDGYIMAVGATSNSAYFMYSATTKTWSEVGAFEPAYVYTGLPLKLKLAEGAISVSPIGFSKRQAGDAENNPIPSFFGYGITGISAYQSRLVLLSGSYICMSKTNEYTQFMRTSVTELLDDDPIEISSASLSAAQFEYAVPYNRDLVLISQQQQAVIPANSTVLTPRTAVIYPSTELDISLSTKPTIVGRTMYYVYQRGLGYYQVGEFIPNTYTESQYYSQNLTDHLPLYAEGVCTSMTASTTSNMVVCCSDSTDVLVNQFMWVGDNRPLMSFHKWKFPYKVRHAHFIREYLVLFMDDGRGGLVVGTLNVQLNQLDDKPIPYLDLYHYLDVVEGVAPMSDGLIFSRLNLEELTTTIYDSRTARHKEVQHTVNIFDVLCPYNGRIAIGKTYESSFTLTPPFIKDDNGKVIAGARSTLQQLRMTFKSTGTFNVQVQDTMGVAYDGENSTALTWSEADLGYSWVNSIGSVTIPCRTRLSSTECSVSTKGTTDMNLVSTEYVLRMASKRRRL